MPDTFALKKAADVPGLIGALAYGRDDAASAALQQIDDPDVAALVRELEDDAWRCRQRAAQALAILYDPRGAEPLGAALRDPEPLTTALRDPRADVRIAAIGALVSCSGPLAVEPIIGALGDESSRVRAEAAWELGALRDPRALEPLIAALQDYYPDVRRNAVWALGMIGGARAVEALSLQRGDHDAGVRERVEKALADLASTSV